MLTEQQSWVQDEVRRAQWVIGLAAAGVCGAILIAAYAYGSVMSRKVRHQATVASFSYTLAEVATAAHKTKVTLQCRSLPVQNRFAAMLAGVASQA